MADETQKPGHSAAVEKAKQASQSSGTVPDPDPFIERYTVEDWKARARTRFHCSKHAIAGALHSAAADELFTEQQVTQALAVISEPIGGSE